MSASVEIADPGGELWRYALKRLTPGLALARYALTKEATGDAYEVRLDRAGAWSCSCPAWQYRNARNREFHRGSCKHVAFVADVHRLLTALSDAPPPRPSVFTLAAH